MIPLHLQETQGLQVLTSQPYAAQPVSNIASSDTFKAVVDTPRIPPTTPTTYFELSREDDHNVVVFIPDINRMPGSSPKDTSNPPSQYDLLSAVQFGTNTEQVADLLARGAQLKDSGALQLAAEFGEPAMVGFLLDKGAEIDEIPSKDPNDIRECRNGTALHKSVKQGQSLDMARLLLERGANPALQDEQEETALEIALRTCSDRQSEVLGLFEQYTQGGKEVRIRNAS